MFARLFAGWYLDRIVANADTTQTPTGFLHHSGVLRAVVTELRTKGYDGKTGISPLEIISLITAILDLIQVLGHDIQAIIAALKGKKGA